jgi:hypothetical protein
MFHIGVIALWVGAVIPVGRCPGRWRGILSAFNVYRRLGRNSDDCWRIVIRRIIRGIEVRTGVIPRPE